ncbi:LysR family transcriptional regulator [Serratia odorifera]|uniref:LysR family transcriptional regulator n=1 Tax=Serratia odorifera TaxID=618 RepID=A0A447KT81_SEROD|nr:LysR family transcriptional regulator [Serratia odorifera]
MNGGTAVNETGLYIKMCLDGFGLVQLAESVVSEYLQAGKLIEVLADWQPPSIPVNLLYPHQRFLSPAVRVFADWVAGLIHNASPASKYEEHPLCAQKGINVSVFEQTQGRKRGHTVAILQPGKHQEDDLSPEDRGQDSTP